jgi:hypothetical protein
MPVRRTNSIPINAISQNGAACRHRRKGMTARNPGQKCRMKKTETGKVTFDGILSDCKIPALR